MPTTTKTLTTQSGKIASTISAVILTASTLSTLGALPMFRLGVWRDSEPTVIAVFALGGIAWLWIGILCFRSGLREVPRTILICFILGLWSCVTSLFAPFPLLSFLGSPQLGEGPALFLSWAGFMLLAWVIWKDRFAIRVALATGALLIFYTALAQHADTTSNFYLFSFPDYIGVFAVLLPALLHCLSHKFSLSSRQRKISVLAGYFVAAWLSLEAQNKGAIAALVIGFMLWSSLVFLFERGNSKLQGATTWGAAIITVLLPIGAIGSLFWIGHSIDIYQEDSAPDIYSGLYSMVSRGLMLNLTANAFDDGGVASYALGNGFGHSLFYIQNYLPLSGQSFLYPHWDIFYRDYVHTHSIPYEVFLSGGALALTLYLAVFVTWIFEAPTEHRATVIATTLSYLALASIWFEFASLVPLLALTIACTLKSPPPETKVEDVIVRPKVRLICTSLIGIFLVSSAGWLYAQNTKLDKEAFITSGPTSMLNSLPDDTARGDISLQKALLDGCRELLNDKVVVSQANPSQRRALWCVSLLKHAYSEIDKSANSSLVLAYLVVAADFANISSNAPSALQDIRQLVLQHWGDVSEHLIEVAPHRVDVLVPYFSYVADNEVSYTSRQTSGRILTEYVSLFPENPIVLWFDGQRKIKDRNPKKVIEGLGDMISAIEDFHLERYIALSDDILEKLKQTQQKMLGR